jgi:hypothetical protein
MHIFEIKRWDAYIPDNQTFAYPLIYIKPSKNFLEYAKKNNNTFLVKIDGTDMQYDKQHLVGELHNSGYYPNYRPKFFNATGLYVILLKANWVGYPFNNGTISFSEPTQAEIVQAEKPKIPIPIEWYNEPKKNNYLLLILVPALILTLVSISLKI